MLESRSARVAEERSARKEPFSDAEVRRLLAGVGKVTIARGNKVTTSPASKVKPADLRGPSGNYRAPILLKGRTLLVGFNREALESFV